MKKSFLVILLFCSPFLLSQESANIKIGVKDNHFSNITSVLATKDEKNILSADETGKILLFSTADYSYKKTILESSGIPIENMRLFKNDSLLMLSKKYKYSDGTTDSLLMISLKDNRILLKEKRSLSFLGNLKNDVIISNTALNYLNTIEFFSQDFTKLLKFETDKTVAIAEISKNKKKVVYTEGDLMAQNNIIIRDVSNGAILKEVSIPDGTTMVHLFFDENSEYFFAVAYLEATKELVVYQCKESINWSKPLYKCPYGSYYSDTTVAHTESNNSHTITFTSKTAYNQKPFVLKNKDGVFAAAALFSETDAMNSTASHALVLNTKNEIVFFKAYNPNFSDLAGFYVFDTTKQKIIGNYPKTTSGFYVGNFLPDNHWMVMKRNDAYGENIKCYATGTFKNRYDQLSIKNYLQVKHAIESIGQTLTDKQNGFQIFEGRERDKVLNASYSYYKYDLVNDKTYKLFDKANNYFAILDYNDKNKALLLSETEYRDQSDVPSRIAIQTAGKTKDLTDTYKCGKFSKNGDYLLTINKDDRAEIRLLSEEKIVYTKQLLKGNYSLMAIDDSSFIITITTNRKIETSNCYSQTIIVGIENGIATDNIKDCVLISDANYVNENMGMIINNTVVVVNNKPVLFKGLESPLEISFNADATKFMLSFKNGSIVIYDTKNFKELGRMIHPDEKGHVFMDNQNHYFSNIDADQYLWATANNQSVSLKSIEKEVFKPEKLLTLFGTPNEEYAKVLQKAETIREATKTTPEDSTKQNSNSAAAEELGKPNLYLISIGVSDYKQSNYNLTFADKDALDISKMYSTLSEKELNAYNDKFFGNKFSVYTKKDETSQSINKFLGTYKSAGTFFNINQNTWVEIENNTIRLWDFDKKIVDSIPAPKDFSIPSYSLDERVFPMPNGAGFAIKGDDDTILSYNTIDKKEKKYKLALEGNDNAWTLLDKDKWLVFNYKHVDSTSTIALSVVDHNNTIVKKIKFNPHRYQEIAVNGGTKTVAVENYASYIIPRLRAVSSDGKYIMYSTDDAALFLVDYTQNNPKPTKITTNSILNYGSKVAIASNGATFCILNNDTNNYTATIFDRFGKIVDSQTIDNADYSVKGFTINEAKPKWIKMSNQLLEDRYFETEDNKVLNSSAPFSFDKVYAANFVNQDANSKAIKSSLSEFFKKTKSNDQVMIFMAGHGMLDAKNNYYFAPHDMDFEKPETNGIAFEFIVNSLKNTPAKNKLLLMDSCHSGTTLDMVATDNAKPNPTGTTNNQRGSGAIAVNQKPTFKLSEVISSLFDNLLSTSGVTILSASSGADVAYEYKNSGNGAFTASYMQSIIEKLNPGTTLEADDFTRPLDLSKEFISDFFKKVMLATDNKQIPDLREINDKAIIKLW